jgi:uncharacterized protein (DUF433 family)
MNKKERTVRQTEYPHIVKAEGVLGGEAIIEGTRIAVWHIVGYYYKVGMSVEDILAEWEYLNPAAIFGALAYYHDHREEIDRVREENSYERWLQEHPVHAPA